jgi:hypothetical protein
MPFGVRRGSADGGVRCVFGARSRALGQLNDVVPDRVRVLGYRSISTISGKWLLTACTASVRSIWTSRVRRTKSSDM